MWARRVSALLGMWLMAAPDILVYDGAAATMDRIVGPLAVSFAVVSIWQVVHGLRWLNLLLGAWLIVAPWLLGYGNEPLLNSLVAGVLLIALSFVRGRAEQRLGGGWSSLLPSGGETHDQPTAHSTERRRRA